MTQTNRRERLITFGALSGLLGPFIVGLGSLITALGYTGVEGQSYRLINHFVSELGEVGVSDLAWVFNLSLVIGGLFNTVFMVALAAQFKHWIKYPLGLLGVVATVNGALVGVFPMNNLGPHIVVAMNFFNLGMVMAFAYSLVILFGKRHPFPKWLAAPGLLTAAAFVVFLNFPSDFDSGVDFQEGMTGMLRNRPDFMPLALVEWVVILGILVWVLMLGGYLSYAFNQDSTG